MFDRPKTATIEDIAKLAGCSKNTVSLALRDSSRISKTTKKKINKIADQIGYVPNISARNLITKKSGIIGIYTRSLYDAVRVELVHTLLNELHTTEYRPVLGLGEESVPSWQQSPWLKTFASLNIEALAVIGESAGNLPDISHRIPTIFIGCYPEEKIRADYVALDRREGAIKGINHLRSIGHKEVVIACDPAMEFADQCVITAEKTRIKPVVIKASYPYGRHWEEEIFRFYKTSSSPPKAIIFGDTPFAVRVMHNGLKHRINPLTKSDAVGYDYFPWSDALQIPITTIEQPIEELSHSAVNLIKRRLNNPSASFSHITLEHVLVPRIRKKKLRSAK
ncbi:MAG: LacI family DNA-binding transcriptional regulator [Spirochaetia bacterium]